MTKRFKEFQQGELSIPGVYLTHSEYETIQLAKRLGEKFAGDEIVYLTGELGAGKTVFTKGLAAGLGLKDITQVCSPSFTLVNVYEGRCPIFHLDLYRINQLDELDTLGWEDFLGQGVIIIEWGEKMPEKLPGLAIKIEIVGENSRRIKIIKRNGESKG